MPRRCASPPAKLYLVVSVLRIILILDTPSVEIAGDVCPKYLSSLKSLRTKLSSIQKTTLHKAIHSKSVYKEAIVEISNSNKFQFLNA